MNRRGAILSFCVFLLAAMAVMYQVAHTLGRLRSPAVTPISPSDWGPLFGAVSLYLLAHLLRALRLVVIVHDERVGLRDTFAAHFIAAGASLLIPFKLGELFRVAEVARLVRSPVRAILLVWAERVLDLLAITGAMLVALAFRRDLADSAAMGVFLTIAVVAGTFIAFYVLPEHLESLKLALIRRTHAPWSLRAVQAVDASQRLLLHAPDAVRRRPATLVLLTAIIWTLEIASLALFLPKAAGTLGATLSATTFFFAQLFPANKGSLSEILTRVMPGVLAGPLATLYPAALFITFLFSSLAAIIAALPNRAAEVLRAVRSSVLSSLPPWMRETATPVAPPSVGEAS